MAVDRRFYQLTHDYLVQSLGDWLTRKQKETRRGRAELKLAERSTLECQTGVDTCRRCGSTAVFVRRHVVETGITTSGI